MGLGEGADPLQVVRHADRAAQVALAELGAAEHRVDVRVLEAGDQQLALQVHHFGARADQLADLVVADGGDPLAGDGEAGGPGAGGVGGEHRAAGEDQVGMGHEECS
ncbi:hypothetical protein [Kitasatospora albolonga]|uniref:hypothetical protein n=1 Tax=Kitasatospora albolonga TaxID=68173 RepID=UPI003CD09F14